MLIAISGLLATVFYALCARDLEEPHGFGTSAYLWYGAGLIISFGAFVVALVVFMLTP